MSATPRQFRLIDSVPQWTCSCGDKLWPDCDMSAASVSDEFERHLRDEHGFTQAEIDAAHTEVEMEGVKP